MNKLFQKLSEANIDLQFLKHKLPINPGELVLENGSFENAVVERQDQRGFVFVFFVFSELPLLAFQLPDFQQFFLQFFADDVPELFRKLLVQLGHLRYHLRVVRN
jgi:hypothetical protein